MDQKFRFKLNPFDGIVLVLALCVGAFLGYNYLKTSGTGEEKAILDELSSLIDQARETNDQAVRTELYKQAMTQILDLAIELPVYQRSVLYAYNSKVVNIPVTEVNPFSSPLDRIWEVEFAQ